ncbi:MAG: YbbR-like protein [Pelotomaculum sp. PtaB.Bin104]|nr:MAG: YbbR-like protein [Pelotomaculum sp. PtaB.Bin104]
MAQENWQNNSIKLLSVLLALILWIYVSNEQNPTGEKLLDIGLVQTGLAGDLIIADGMPEIVRVRVVGNKTQLANINPGDLKAVVDLSQGEAGDITLPVQISAPPGVRVAQVIPAEVRLSLDSLVEKVLSVTVSLRGTPAPGFTALAPVCRPETVSVNGPGRVVNTISQVTAVVDINTATKDVNEAVTVSVSVAGITVKPATVQVTVPIAGTTLSKAVPVKPQFSGTPAAGFTITRSYAEPASVQISGPVEVLNTISEIKTMPVDINGVSQNLVREVSLAPVAGIFYAQPGRVKVYLDVNKTEQQVEEEPNTNGSNPPKP